MPTYHLLVKGEVQGVFYRQTASKVADKLNIYGWIRNLQNGDVEAKICGDEASTQEFIAWCRKGPEKAEVEDVQVTEVPDENFRNFSVIR
jgi:acylphosphatase